ncbi:MAG TPA: cupin domain-containing protein [Patescibacteria group bacterium]|nr:cupin domain-containing protein [Patescibacteria group bacterium]
MRQVEHRDFAKPDETRAFAHGRAEILNTASGVVGRLVLEPGWRWSTDVKPIARTEWCEAPHFQYHESGTLRVQMSDGSEFDVGPGQLTSLPAGHDAWVVGGEPVVAVDFYGATDYAKG